MKGGVTIYVTLTVTQRPKTRSTALEETLSCTTGGRAGWDRGAKGNGGWGEGKRCITC